MKRIWRRFAPALAVLAACGGSADEGTAEETLPRLDDPAVVAAYRGGQIAWDDVDGAILELPARERQRATSEGIGWYEGLIRELAIDRILSADGEADRKAEDSELAASREEIRRQVVVEAYLERNMPSVDEVSDSEVRAYYDEHREEYDRQARRRVLHIFKRRAPGADLGPVKEQVAELRRRVLAGDGFELLATQHSDSESRHTEGVLGWVTRDQLPPALAEVIFSLEEGVPSEPIPTAEGVHLFFVEQAIEERRFGFEEVELMIRGQLQAERARQAATHLAEELPMPEDAFVPSADELSALLSAGDPEATVLQLDDYVLTLAHFRGLLMQTASSTQQTPSLDLATQILRGLAARERIFSQGVAAGLEETPEVASLVERRQRRARLRLLRQRALQRKVASEPERLREYFENNRSRFSTPLRLDLRRLKLPIVESEANRHMTSLEEAAALSASTDPEPSLDEIAAELGAEIEELGWQTLDALKRIDSRLPALISTLRVGQISPPYRSEAFLEAFELRGRREPQEVPFAEALEEVQNAILVDHGQEIYADWVSQTLEDHGFTLLRDRLEDLAGGIQGIPAQAPTGSGTSQ